MKKVLVYAMGGTIAMTYDEGLGGLTPTVSGEDLVSSVPRLKGLCGIETIEFSKEPSSRITPEIMLKLAKDISRRLECEDVSGAIVTHGTDTLEETAYFLDLYLNTDKPVCVTGAMRSPEEISADGPANIFASALTVISEDAAGMGVTVVANDEIHAARDVIKTHSSNVKTFVSPSWGPLGYIDADKAIFHRRPFARENLSPDTAKAFVPLVKIYTGMDNSYLDFLCDKSIDGLVVEAFGRGNISDVHMSAVKGFINKNIPVVVATRTIGRPSGVYAYSGGGKSLQEAGAVFAGELTAAKARLKLILVLGLTKDIKKVASFFDI